MKVIVVTEFRDKHTGELHRIGEGLDITKKRFSEILRVGSFIEEVKEAAENEQV